MTFTQAQSARLGQRVAPETTYVQIFDVDPSTPTADLVEAAWPGMLIFRKDRSILQIFNGDEGAWQDVAGGVAFQLTFVGPSAPTQDPPLTVFSVGDVWYDDDDSFAQYVWDGSTWKPVSGNAVTSYVTEYALNSSEATAPTTGWSTAPPTRTPGTFIWVRTTTNRLNGTSSVSAPVLMTGNTGPQGPQGEPGSSSSVYEYTLSTTNTPPPSTGQARTNATGAAASTALYLHYSQTGTSGSYAPLLRNITAGDELTVQDKNDPTQYARYLATADAVDFPAQSYVSVAVAFQSGAGVGKNNQAILVFHTLVGQQGPQGVPGPTGPAGATGPTLYTWLKYADSPTTGMSDDPTGKSYLGVAYNRPVATESTNYADYEWSLTKGVQGNQGIPGPAGSDGQPTYTWVKYADTVTGTGMSDDPTGKIYIGFAYNKTTITESSNPADYQWALIQGPQGPQGVQGPQGATGSQGIQGPAGPTGQPTYTWIKYADSPTTGMSDSPAGKAYMGIAYNKLTQTESVVYGDYEWSLTQGAQGNQGIQGPAGPSGQATYTWIKYGTSSSGAGLSDDPTGKTYIGIAYNKTTATESTNPTDYEWSLIQGPQGATGPTGSQGPQGNTGSQGPTGNTGAPGVGISSTAVTYQVGNSGTTAPTGTWVATPQATSPGQFLWTRTITTLTDATQTTAYAVSAHGSTGATGSTGNPGVGVSGTAVTYQVGSSGSTAPTGTWQSTPQVTSPGQFLWTRTITTYTDTSTSTAYSISAHGQTGATGSQGPQGNTGNTGAAGADAYTVLLTNEAQVIPAGTTNATGTPPSYVVGVIAYKGATRILATIGTITGQVTGLTTTIQNNGTTTAQVTVAVTSALNQAGTLTIPITVDGQVFTQVFSWSLSLTGAQGSTGSQGPTGSTGSQGPAGANGPAVALTATSQIMAVAVGGGITPATVTVTGTPLNTTITSWTYSVDGAAFSATVPPGVSRAGNVVTITGSTMTARTISVQMADANGVGDVLTVSKVSDGATGATGSQGPQGNAGAPAASIELTATAQVLVVPAAGGATNPTTSTVSGTSFNTTIDKYEYSVDSGAFTTTPPTGAVRTGNNVTVTGGTFTGKTLTIKMSNTASGNSDSYTVAKVSDGATGAQGSQGNPGTPGAAGADAYTVLLTNEAQTIQAGTTNAIVPAPQPSTGVVAYKGTVLQTVQIGTITGGATGITAAVRGGTNNTTAPVIDFTVTTSLVAANGTFTIPCTVAGFTVNKVFAWSLSFTGSQGATGSQGPTGNTGAAGVGITSITPYWAQVTTGAAAPAQPSTATPVAPWVATEPAFVTNTELYRCDKVLKTDATYSYTTVVKSSSYAGVATKSTSYYGATAPWTDGSPGRPQGDLWFNTAAQSVNNVPTVLPYMWDATNLRWLDVSDPRVKMLDTPGGIPVGNTSLDQMNDAILANYQTATSAQSLASTADGRVSISDYDPSISDTQYWAADSDGDLIPGLRFSVINKVLTNSVATLTIDPAGGLMNTPNGGWIIIAGVGAPFDGEWQVLSSTNTVPYTVSYRIGGAANVASTVVDPPATSYNGILQNRVPGSIWFTRTRARQNYCSNPSFEFDLTGWAGVQGTLTRVTGSTVPDVTTGTSVAQMANNAVVGDHRVEWAGGTPGLTAVETQDWASTCYALAVSGTNTGCYASVRFYNSSQVLISEVAGQVVDLDTVVWRELKVAATAPPATATMAAIVLHNPNASAVWKVDAGLVEKASYTGKFFDGDSYDGRWTDPTLPKQSSSILVGGKIVSVYELYDENWIRLDFTDTTSWDNSASDLTKGTLNAALLGDNTIPTWKLLTNSMVLSDAVTAGQLVNVWNNAGLFMARPADASVAGKEAYGYVLVAGAAGATVPVYSSGLIAQGLLTGLQPGPQFLSTTPGQVTVTPPNVAGQVIQQVGFASDQGTLNFEAQPPVLLN